MIPNFRTFPALDRYKSITPKEKFDIAAADSFDLGNATAVVISNACYPDSRDVSSAVSKFGPDLASNVLKEFWPDLRRKLSRGQS